MGWRSAWNSVKHKASKAWKKIKKKAKKVVDDVVDDVKDAASDLADTWQAALRHTAACSGVGTCLLSAVTGILAGAVGTVGNIVDLVFDATGWIYDAVATGVGIVIGGVIDVLGIIIPGQLGEWLIDLGNKVIDIGATIGKLANDAWDAAGDVVEMVTDWIAVAIMQWARSVICSVGLALDADPISVVINSGKNRGIALRGERSGFQRIEHFFILMLENRSFDHMLGHWDSVDDPRTWLRNPGVEGVPAGGCTNYCGEKVFRTGIAAKDSLKADPPHEFDSVRRQIGPADDMGGFVAEFARKHRKAVAIGLEDPGQVMQGYTPRALPVLHQLGYEFAICDNWFSSLPGPTQPNRLFVHAATSGGLADSVNSSLPLGRGLSFENGTLFESLSRKCFTWCVYSDGPLPMTLMLDGIEALAAMSGSEHMRGGVDTLVHDLEDADDRFPAYSFIEPDYGEFFQAGLFDSDISHGDFRNGNSQHPLDSVASGERLIKKIYEALVVSPIWESSALIVTYDEHGGFYDHVPPPSAEPPGDRTPYRSLSTSVESRGFAFDRLGVRVPAIVVSPYLDRRTVDPRCFDHSSIVATVSARFDLGHLTERDRNATTLERIFSRRTPRRPGASGADGCPRRLGAPS